MKKFGIFLIMLGLMLVPVLSFAQQGDQAQQETIDVGNKVCPVMGNKIAEGYEVKVEYKGKIYNLCCPGCIEEFLRDPEKYVKIAEEMREQGGK